jgi:hypothetical protein
LSGLKNISRTGKALFLGIFVSTFPEQNVMLVLELIGGKTTICVGGHHATSWGLELNKIQRKGNFLMFPFLFSMHTHALFNVHFPPGDGTVRRPSPDVGLLTLDF